MKFVHRIILLLSVISCTDPGNTIDSSNSEKIKSDPETNIIIDDDFNQLRNYDITSISLYCMCFSDSIVIFCNTFNRVQPGDLINPESKIGNISDSSGYKEFIKEFQTGYQIGDTIPGMDVRLVASIKTTTKELK